MENNSQKGFLLITAVILISIIGIFGASIVYMFSGSAIASAKQLASKQSFYIAESGLEYGLRQIVESGTACSDIDTTFPNPVAFGQGEFQIQATLYSPSPSATLSSAINDTTTTIPLNSTTGYSDTGGRITIDDEIIDYTSISGNSLIGARRGRDATTAVSHTSGTDVTQNQCDLTVSGGVPTIAAGSSEKQILADIQIPAQSGPQSGWIVGKPSPSEEIYEWNSTGDPNDWARWGPSGAIYNNVDFYGVYAVAINDVWAGGENGNIIHYDGSGWTFFQDIGNDTVRGIYCNNASDCWAVSDNDRIFHYNGTSWSEDTDVGSGDLNTVYCNDGSDCWTAGDDGSGNGDFYHYNGSTWSFSQQIPLAVKSIYCNGASDCWAATEGEKIYHYNGTTWSQSADLGTGTLNSVYCNSASNCWAVGENASNEGVFYHYNGTSWSFDSNATVPLYGVACFDGSDCWAAADDAIIYHYNGTAWSLNKDFSSNTFWGISLTTNTGVKPSKVAWRVVTN